MSYPNPHKLAPEQVESLIREAALHKYTTSHLEGWFVGREAEGWNYDEIKAFLEMHTKKIDKAISYLEKWSNVPKFPYRPYNPA